jgi:hypothetical protein
MRRSFMQNIVKPSPLAAIRLYSLVFGWERGRLRAMCSTKSHRSIMQARSRWPWRGRGGGLALCYPSLTRVRSNISRKMLRAGSLQLTREKYELLAEVPEWSHRGSFQGRALKSRHRGCLRAFATAGSCAIFAFPVSRPTSVAPLATTFSSLRRAIVPCSGLDPKRWETTRNGQPDVDFSPLAIVPGAIGAIAKDVLVAQFARDVLGDARKIVGIGEGISAGSCQTTDASQKSWPKYAPWLT